MEVMNITPMERYMLQLIRKGHKDREICTYLNCQQNTLKQRITRLLSKTGCPNRVALVDYAHENNFFTKQTQQ